MELNAEQIIKAFEICRDQDLCNECPYEENIDCLRLKEKHAIALMKSQGQKIDELTKDVEWSAKRILEADKKVAELTEDNEAQSQTITNLLKTLEGVQGVKSEYETFIGGMKSQIDKIKADAKADNVSEIKTRFAMRYGTYTDKDMTPIADVFRLLDQIAKEILGEET